jgi:hypothetical protein
MVWKFQVLNTENKEIKMKKLLLTTLTVFAFSAQADFLPSSHNWNNGSSDPLKSAISSAKAENKKAKSVGFEWRDTGKMIKQAAKVGGAKGIALANKAKAQAIDAQKQAVEQASAGPNF